ncbi:hypothetical protein [Pseudoalteromonas sp. SWN166]|uniref:hypothetical protein n=2 Tax=unclassified Pseudoalteromonas TaxID=194690 RepID=UPI0018CCDCE3|nr:hypothetical protein [Pseudoalteromonas sp. SWN166]MBH0039312.1 hypothetical protein [Pseudoalteromonas sp. SWN166]
MTEHEKQQKEERDFLKIIMIIFLSTMLGVCWVFGHFFGFSPSKNLDVWYQTATIFTGVTTPFISAISVFLLYFVWKDNRRELAETKKALTEQSDTQNFSVIKDAVFEIADQVKVCLQKDVVMGMGSNGWILSNVNSPVSDTRFLPDEQGKEQRDEMKLESFLQLYFTFTRSKPIEKNRYNDSMKELIFSNPTFEFIEKVKTIALFVRETKSINYKNILEITLFAKLNIFTWMMFVEISFHLFKTATLAEKETAELVFEEIAGLTCRQLKEVYWIDALSDEVLLELNARKLL